eukprot:TRINITY_DN3089_c0_g2_i1.p3 TRINITY_DN3089_c0_g2~~TRINITY_DN3089_c0_g2_i1.p3  ORF type:complete len:102 (+),score=29.02 TRINITY_DN3089_c0_g2_i1:155-460(+)
MLASRSFVKKTRRGGIVRVVREHYMRDDIWCGSMICDVCGIDDPEYSAILQKVDEYVVPDTNVILHQMDALSHPCFKNVIILQTVLNEVKHRYEKGERECV